MEAARWYNRMERINLMGIWLEGDTMVHDDNGKRNVMPIIKIRQIAKKDHKHTAIAEYIHLRGVSNKQLCAGLQRDNQQHQDLCLFESAILGIHPTEVLLSCAEWAHELNFAPDQIMVTPRRRAARLLGC